MNYKNVIDIIFPRRCPVCDDAVDGIGKLVCDDCRDIFRQVKEPYCMKCGKPIIDDSNKLCSICESTRHEFTEGRAAFVYDETMKDSVYRFKYGKRREYAEYYGKQMADRFKGQLHRWSPDAIIPVPVHKKRLKQRGYNQAELIARVISRETGIPLNCDVLVRDEDTKVQKNLTLSDRQNNLKKALKIGTDVVKLKNVVIVDDIYTTGSTIDAAALSLRAAGVDNIYFMVLCSGDIS